MEKIISKITDLKKMDMSPSSIKESVENFYGEHSPAVRKEIYDKINNFKENIESHYEETKDDTT